jgi:hypothetical protein
LLLHALIKKHFGAFKGQAVFLKPTQAAEITSRCGTANKSTAINVMTMDVRLLSQAYAVK